MPDSLGDGAQVRRIIEQVAASYEDKHLTAEVPPMVKWLVGAIAAFGTASLIGLGFWLVSSVSTMRETLARMDERQVISSQALADRFRTIDERLGRLEEAKKVGGR